MIKKIVKDGYEIVFDKPADITKEEALRLAKKAIRFADKQSRKDEVGDVYIEDKISEEEMGNYIGMAMILKNMHKDESDKQIIDRVFAVADIGPGAWSPEEMQAISERLKEALAEVNIIRYNGAEISRNPDGRYMIEGFGESYSSLEEAKKGVDYWLKEGIRFGAKIKDIPLNAPEENVSITYTEKLKGGKNALTYGMIENAFKERAKDEGKTFAAYVDVALESLKEDLANAKDLVSGEMKSTRSLLLEDYIKIERLIQKAGMKDKLDEFRPLVDKLSDELNLNYWKQPKFKKAEQRQASKELRAKHRYDSRITKTVTPVFLCSETDLDASYNDAKQGKLPQVFEGNLSKVEKDMEADYDRINHGRDHYLDDPRIVAVLPKIVRLYEKAQKYAAELGYKDIAERFAFMLSTIKKGWGME